MVVVRSAWAKNEAENLTHQIHGKCFAWHSRLAHWNIEYL